MRLIKCPEVYKPPASNRCEWMTSLFLAGGISNCPDWQTELARELRDTKLTLIDPRRDDFDVDDPAMTEQQIEWEHAHLRNVYAIAFWFPEETLCPITLFELGRASSSYEQDLVIGCHPNYGRIRDVIKQVDLARPEVIVHDNWDDFVNGCRVHAMCVT